MHGITEIYILSSAEIARLDDEVLTLIGDGKFINTEDDYLFFIINNGTHKERCIKLSLFRANQLIEDHENGEITTVQITV